MKTVYLVYILASGTAGRDEGCWSTEAACEVSRSHCIGKSKHTGRKKIKDESSGSIMWNRTKCEKLAANETGTAEHGKSSGMVDGIFSFQRAGEKEIEEGVKKRERAIFEQIAAHSDTVQALTDQSREDGAREGGQSSQNPSLGGLKWRRERDGGEGKQRTEISGEG